jgi:hypothetical protein
MFSNVKDAVKELAVACKAVAIRSMHRQASGWDAQGMLPAMRLPQTEPSRKPRGPLHFNFSGRSRKRLGWTHFLAGLGH